MLDRFPTVDEFIEDPEKNRTVFWNFWDWFCSEKSLKNRALDFVPKLKWLRKNGSLNGDYTIVFKNHGTKPTYDSVIIKDKK